MIEYQIYKFSFIFVVDKVVKQLFICYIRKNYRERSLPFSQVFGAVKTVPYATP